MTASPFLEIAESEWLASNALAFAVADRFPVSPGHTLVITRRLTPTWWDATALEQAALIALVNEVRDLLTRRFQPDGFNVGFNAGDAAGQTIDHLHLHVIPRYRGDVEDPRGGVRHVIPALGNYLAERPEQSESPVPSTQLVTPKGGRFHRELRRRLSDEGLDQIDLLVSFIMRSGVQLIAEQLESALNRGATIRILTTDYLMVTDVGALGFLLDRLGAHQSGGRLDVRVFSDPSTSFHPKAYIFTSTGSGAGVAYVGSSNLSWSGLRHGVEWNLETDGVEILGADFNELWDDLRSLPLSVEWLEAYRQRKELHAAATRDNAAEAAIADEQPEAPIAPWSVQAEALDALERTRSDGHQAGLVVMATGLGKTWLAAFDSARPAYRRVLFVAHREEILAKSRDVFRRVRPGGSYSFFTGDARDASGEVVFASVQTLQRHLDEFDPRAFDYIVVDEFHHAAAPTYRRTIGHFNPKFMLGLTATPDRTDAADLLALCGDNLVYECGLAKGLERELLSPFHYRAIRDVVDYEEIPWRSGRFVIEALSERLETQARGAQVFEEWRALNGERRRALAFCCSINHADVMARYFTANGVRAVSVHGGPSSADRVESLDLLESGELQVVFCVDLFNEGVDVPLVDIVMMLRPTDSTILFFQQLGRGLRKADGKGHLDVLDMVGNHRSFLLKARLLAALAGHPHVTDREAVALLRDSLDDLPPGCSIIVDTEAIDLMTALVGAPRRQDRVTELTRAWVDEHEGERPTALEISLALNGAIDVKARGGWFGLLSSLGLLSEHEARCYELAREFFIEIEHGSYTKSYKLVTIKAMLTLASLRSQASLRDVALNARWQIFRDPRLLADLSDATNQFVDVRNPSEAEWTAYWRRNPIAALIGVRRDGEQWFDTDETALRLRLEVPAELSDVFDEMVGEIVDYRLHRYLVTRQTRRLAERRRPFAKDGRLIDAAFAVEAALGEPLSVVFESAGGAGPDGKKRNPDYVEGIDVVLARLQELGATILDAYVDSTRTQQLPVEQRRLLAEGQNPPIDLQGADLAQLRGGLLRRMATVGRSATALQSGGNSRKTMRLVLGGLEHLDPATVGGLLAGGSTAASGEAETNRAEA